MRQRCGTGLQSVRNTNGPLHQSYCVLSTGLCHDDAYRVLLLPGE